MEYDSDFYYSLSTLVIDQSGVYSGSKFSYVPDIKEVIFREPATIVNWCDGTKTIVRCNNEVFDEEKGLSMAIARKYMESRAEFERVMKNARRQT